MASRTAPRSESGPPPTATHRADARPDPCSRLTAQTPVHELSAILVGCDQQGRPAALLVDSPLNEKPEAGVDLLGERDRHVPLAGKPLELGQQLLVDPDRPVRPTTVVSVTSRC